MNLQGERIIPASIERTWVALNDPETLKACIAGCESIEITGENQFLATMAVRIGPVNAKFKGRLQLSDIVPMQSYKINFDGQGGVAGFGKGSADVTLAPEGTAGDATKLNYNANAQVGGKIAQIGSRLVESAAAKIAQDFFKAFEARMTASPADATAPAEAGIGAAPSGTAAGEHAVAGGNASFGGAAGASASFAAASNAGGDPDSSGLPRPAPTVDHVAGRVPEQPGQPVAAGGASSLWWIAGIIILALLAYFFTR